MRRAYAVVAAALLFPPAAGSGSSAVPATVALTLTSARGYVTFHATWPASTNATQYRIYQAEGSGPSTIVAVTKLRGVALSLPCGKTTRSNVGPLNSTGQEAKLAPPVYTTIPPC